MEVAFVDFGCKCAVGVSDMLFWLGLSFVNRDAFLLFVSENDFLTFWIDERLEGILIFEYLILLIHLTFNISLLVFCPCEHFIVIFIRRSELFALIFLFYFIHVRIELFFEYFVLFQLTFLFDYFVLRLLLLTFLYDSIASHVDWVIINLGSDSTRVGVYARSIFNWIDLLFLKLLFTTLYLSLFFSLELLNSVVKTVWFFQLCYWFLWWDLI